MVFYNGFKPKNGKENKWVDIYNINIKNKTSIESVFGARTSNDDLFKPGKHFLGFPSDAYRHVNHNTTDNFDLAFESIINNNIPEVSRLKCINDKGFISPVERHYIKYVYNKMN